MNSLPRGILAILLVSMVCLEAGATPVARVDSDGPSLGAQVLELHELWRIGGLDEEVIFGRIVDVKMRDNGEVYILDSQLCHVVVLSSEGKHLRTLSRQGDGPGELRQPVCLVFLPDDVLGVGKGFPGKLTTMEMDGTPIGTSYPIGEPAKGTMVSLMSVNCVDNVLVALGAHIVLGGPDNSHVFRFLSVSEFGGGDFAKVLERKTPVDPTGHRFVETDEYFIDDQNWALGPGGNIFAPMERDVYAISVFNQAGELQYTFGREYTPRERTQEEKDGICSIFMGGDPANREWDIADYDEAVSRIMINPDDETVWVLTPNRSHDQPKQIIETWDVFTLDGEYLRQVGVPLGDETNDGIFYVVRGNRLVVVRGTGSPFDDQESDEDEDLEEIEPLEVICYEVR